MAAVEIQDYQPSNFTVASIHKRTRNLLKRENNFIQVLILLIVKSDEFYDCKR